jgi:hypothetical protein
MRWGLLGAGIVYGFSRQQLVTAGQDTDKEWAVKKAANAAAAAAAKPAGGSVAEPGEAGFDQKTWEAAIEAKYAKK